MAPQPTLIAAVHPGAQAMDEGRVQALSGRIICNCDCGSKIVQKCYCGVADSLRQEIRSQVAAGATDEQILSRFVGQYGEAILAAPVPEGFNLTAWAAPLAALLCGFLVVALVLRRWRRAAARRPAPPAGSQPPAGTDPYLKAFEAEYASRRD